jgi:hypothetical protein
LRLPAIAGLQRLKPARSNRKCIKARNVICRRGTPISATSWGSPRGTPRPITRIQGKSTRNSTRPGSDSSTASPTSSPSPDCWTSGS